MSWGQAAATLFCASNWKIVVLGAISPEVSSLETRRSNITPCSIVSEAVAMEGNGREIAAAREAKKQKARERERQASRCDCGSYASM